MRLALLILSVLLSQPACLSEDKLKISLNMTPAVIDDDWQVASPESEGFDSAKLADVYTRVFSANEYHTAYSLLIIRHGKLVAEGYMYDLGDIDRLNNIKSATKSVTSILTGIALDEGYFKSVSQPVTEFLPTYFDPGSTKSEMTLFHLLTMTSGLHWENSDETTELMVDEPKDSLSFVLDQPLDFKPGSKFHYADGNPHVLGAIIQDVTGMALEDYAFEKLFTPLGITDYIWEMHGDGVNYGAYGLYLRPRDLAKIGQFALNQGVWQGTQVVASSWITAATQTYANENDGPYGYYWWIRPDFKAYMAMGHGGQYVYVVPDKDLVIVMTANPYTDGIGVTREQFEVLVYWTLDAITK